MTPPTFPVSRREFLPILRQGVIQLGNGGSGLAVPLAWGMIMTGVRVASFGRLFGNSVNADFVAVATGDCERN